MTTDTLIAAPEQLTSEVLTAALRAGGSLRAGAVRSVVVTPLGDNEGTTGRLFRVKLAYEGDAPGAPSSLIAKFPREDGPALEVARRFRLYEREACFYSEIAPLPELRTPRLYCRTATILGDPVLLLEDMAPAREGDIVAGAGLGTLAPIVDALARMHAQYWGSASLAAMPWLPRPNATMTVRYSLEQYEPAWRGFRDRMSLNTAVVDAGERLRGDRSVLDRMAGDPCTLTHGDLRLNNMMFEADGSFGGAVDWQSVTFARGPGDLAALVIANLPREMAGAAERELVRRYHEALRSAGVREYDFDACWTDYRLGALAQFAGVVMLSAFMDLGRNRDETAEAIIGRPVAAVERLELADLLPRRRRPGALASRVRAAIGRGLQEAGWK